MKKNIMFVCNGNIYQSVVAQKYLKNILIAKGLHDKFIITSSGLQGSMGTPAPQHNNLISYHNEYLAAKEHFNKYGININKHRSKIISETLVKKANTVIAMSDEVFSEKINSLMIQFPNYNFKLKRFSDLSNSAIDTSDPFGLTSKNLHENIVNSICETIKENYMQIIDWTKSS